jgi:uncharacterized protein involved in exopolysaccharide biosynthesis
MGGEIPMRSQSLHGEMLVRALFYRRAIARVAAVLVLLAVSVVLLRDRTWTARGSFIAQSGQAETFDQLAGLASQVGLNFGGTSGGYTPRFYAALATSTQILGVLVDTVFTLSTAPPQRVRLADALDVSGKTPGRRREYTIRELRESVISAEHNTQTGITTLSVRTKSPELSFEIAQTIMAEINRFNSERRRSRASAEREFTSERRAAVAKELEAAEEEVAAFVTQNRSYTGSAELRLRFDRLNRRVTELSQVLAAVTQLYERARIDEVRDTPVLTVVDAPVLPAVPDGRGLLGAVIAVGIVGLVLAVGTILALQVTGTIPAPGLDAPSRPADYVPILRRELARPWRLLL